MNALGHGEYLKLICETLVSFHGDSLVERDTDLEIAKKVLRKLKPYLYFHVDDMTPKEFKAWRQKFKGLIK